MENEDKKTKLTKEQVESKIYLLTLETEQIKAKKKASNKSFTEELKSLRKLIRKLKTSCKKMEKS
jgi:hypothetical protein